MSRYLVVMLVAVSLFSVSACSKGESGAASTKSYDPCDLITQARAEEALGIKLKVERHDTSPTNPLGQKICMYGDAADQEMKFVQLSIQAQADMKAPGQYPEGLFESTKSFVENPREFTGLGSAAYYGGSGLQPGAGLSVLDAPKGVLFTVMVGLGVGNADDAAHLALEKKLAQEVLEKL